MVQSTGEEVRTALPGAKVQGPYDFLVDTIISIAQLDTTKEWKLTNLSYPDIWVFCLCVSGKCRYQCGENTYIMQEGDAALFAPGLVRSAQACADDPWTFVVAKFHVSGMNEAARQLLSSFPVYIPQLQKKVSDLFLHCEAVWRSRRSTHLITCRSILMEILSRLIQEEEENTLLGLAEKRIRPALRLLENGEDRTSEQLAETVGLSVSHFRTLFKQTTGYTVTQYKNYLRVSRARDILLMRNCSVSEVAELVGIPDLFYFSRLFKQFFGVPPTQIRNH